MFEHWFSECQKWRLPNHRRIRAWLLWRESMSLRIKRYHGKALRVKVVSQSWKRPQLSEQQALNLSTKQYCLIREVELFIDNTLMMTARSIMPKGCLTEQYRIKSVSKNTPIGQWLFKHPNLKRSLFTIQSSKKNKLWVRRSLLKTPEQKLLLTETFIPEIFL